MNPIVFALRHPYTVMVAVVALVLGAGVSIRRTPVDIFPDLNTPVIYVAQPYGGMDPQQMEAFLTYYYEYHFLYITGIHHVEARNIQGVALMKLYFHPGTNMAQAMAETVNYVNRARSFMPVGTVPPFIMRFDAGSVPVGYLVFKSDRSVGDIQNQALNFVRPMFAALPGVSAPPPFGGNQRTVVIHANPDSLRAQGMSPDEVVNAILAGNVITPSGSFKIGNKAPMVPVDSVVTDPKDLGNIVIRADGDKPVFLRDIGAVEVGTDVPTGYGLVNGKRSVYILVTKRADASTLDVVREVKANIPKMQEQIPADIQVSFEFDQSPYVSRAIQGVGLEAILGAILTGLMVLLFLRDWRSVVVVVLNIPLALLGSVVALSLTGQTINLMTLGGLALSVGILVDEATVEVENIHTQMGKTSSIARAVRLGNAETAVPRLLAMLCILAVFIPSFFMEGAARALFVPLALAVGFAMVTSYLLSSTFVPVLSVWLLRHYHPAHGAAGRFSFTRARDAYARLMQGFLRLRWFLVVGYIAGASLLVVWWLLGHRGLGTEIFPTVDAGQFVLRVRAPDGTPLEDTEALAQDVLDAIAEHVGKDKVDLTVSLVGTASYNYPINSIFLWTAGPQEAFLRVALKPGSGIHVGELQEQLRQVLPTKARKRRALPEMKDVQLSFEAGDIVGDVMSFGSPTPIEVAVTGKNYAADRAYTAKLLEELKAIPSLRDRQYRQPLDYPTVQILVDRQKAGLAGVTAADIGRALAPVTLSSRFLAPSYWRDPESGIGFQVQLQVSPGASTNEALGMIPVKRTAKGMVLVRDVATIREGTLPGEDDRYNSVRLLSLTANIHGEDLGRVSGQIDEKVRAVNDSFWVSQEDAEGKRAWKNTLSDEVVAQDARPNRAPKGISVQIRGQTAPMQQMFQGLGIGLLMAVVVIFLLLTAYFQSMRLAFVVISTAPAVLAGVVLMLVLTGTTLNIQSFMGSIMAIGVAVANAILLVTFAERARLDGASARDAAVDGVRHRLRPILMTSCAMLAGMTPMALALGEGGEQTAPLGRAVVGGLVAATIATLTLLPAVFAVIQGWAGRRSASLDPDDTASRYFEKEPPRANGDRRDGAETVKRLETPR
jgi:multidrug efflux pump subunit AcrB